jgi:hypothetical protein
VRVVKLGTLLIAALSLVVLGTGCSAGPQELDKDYMANAEQLGKDRKAIFDKASGDWSKMSEDDKSKFMKGFSDEAAAQKFWDVMKSGPPGGAPPKPNR